MKCVLLIVLSMFAAFVANAQGRSVERRMVIDIPFVLASGDESGIRYDLDSVKLANSLNDLNLLNNDKTSTIKSVEFYSSVSPEGTIRFNKTVGKQRLQTAERVVRQRLHIGDSIAITHDERYIPWHTYLLPAIEADSTVPCREELLKLVYRPADAKGADHRRANLKRSKKLWNIVEERYFDHIRKGGAIIVVESTIYDDLLTDDKPLAVVKSVSEDALHFEEPATPAKREPSVVTKSELGVSVKSNALFWGLGITNASVEFDVAKHWSVSIPILYAAYNYFKPTIKFRTFATQPEVRYWFKENNMGLFVGAHLGVGSYNLAVNGDIRYQDHNGKSPAYGGGIGVGYRMSLSKKRPNWQVEFLIGAGVYGLHYDTFHNVENGRYIGTYRKTYWGIDNAAVNFSYRFNYNKRKR